MMAPLFSALQPLPRGRSGIVSRISDYGSSHSHARRPTAGAAPRPIDGGGAEALLQELRQLRRSCCCYFASANVVVRVVLHCLTGRTIWALLILFSPRHRSFADFCLF